MSYLNKATKRMVSVVVLAMVMGAFATSAVAQGSRALKSKVTPSYPELAKKMNVNGAVKVELLIGANGSVKSAKAIGGHPLLIDAAVNAAKQFKYEAGEESTLVVEFKFNNGQ